MTGELVRMESFEEIPIRIIQGKDCHIPLVDIARAIGCDRSNLSHIIKKNAKIFEGLISIQYLSTNGGLQKSTCVSRDGVIALLVKFQPSRADSQGAEDKVITFQKWAINTLGKAIDGEPVTALPTRNKVDGIFEEYMNIAQIIHEKMGVSKGISQASAIRQLEKLTGQDFTWCKNLIPGNNGLRIGNMTPGHIGSKIGKSAKEINKILEELGYQVKSPRGGWQLTIPGMIYGEMVPYVANNGHSDYRPLWNTDVLAKIQNYRPGLLEGQKGLLTGYIA